MAEDKSRESYTGDDDTVRGRSTSGMGGGRASSRSDMVGVSSRFEKFYNLLDAVIDQVDMTHGRNRALKHGIRAIGEFIAEMPETSPRRKVHHESERHSSVASDVGRRTKSKSKSSKGSASKRG